MPYPRSARTYSDLATVPHLSSCWSGCRADGSFRRCKRLAYDLGRHRQGLFSTSALIGCVSNDDRRHNVPFDTTDGTKKKCALSWEMQRLTIHVPRSYNLQLRRCGKRHIGTVEIRCRNPNNHRRHSVNVVRMSMFDSVASDRRSLLCRKAAAQSSDRYGAIRCKDAAQYSDKALRNTFRRH